MTHHDTFSQDFSGHLPYSLVPALQWGLNLLIIYRYLWAPTGGVQGVIAPKPGAVTEDFLFARKVDARSLGGFFIGHLERQSGAKIWGRKKGKGGKENSKMLQNVQGQEVNIQQNPTASHTPA